MTREAALPLSMPITMGKMGTPVDWSGLARRWQQVFGTPFPQPRLFGPALQLEPAELRALGFCYASGDKKPPRVDLNS